MLKSIKKRERMILIKEPSSFILGKYNLDLVTLKVLALLFTKINKDDKDFTQYEIEVKEISEYLGKEYGEIYNVIKKKFLKLLDVKIELEDENTWKAFTLVVDPVLEKGNGIIKFYLSPNFLKLIKNSLHYVKYNSYVLAYLNSAYALRLYKILKDRLEIQAKYNTLNYKVSLKKLRELLQIPNSYLYANIKQKVLNKAKEEINKYTDIRIDFIEHKKGRKVDEIEFIVTNNPNSLIPSKMNNTKTVNKKQPGETNKSVKSDNFVTDLRKKLNNTDNLILLGEDIYKIKDNLLYKNDTLLNKNESLEEYKYLQENKDKLKITSPAALKEDNKNKIKEELISIYKNKTLKGLPVKINGEIQYINAVLLDIEDFTDIDNFTVLLQSGEKIFKMKMSLESLKNYFK